MDSFNGSILFDTPPNSHHLKSVSVLSALKMRLAVSSLTLVGSRKMLEIHIANSE